MYMERRRGGKKMRRTKRFAGFALAACMGVSLLVNVPVGTVSAEEPTEMVVADIAETSEADFDGAAAAEKQITQVAASAREPLFCADF